MWRWSAAATSVNKKIRLGLLFVFAVVVVWSGTFGLNVCIRIALQYSSFFFLTITKLRKLRSIRAKHSTQTRNNWSSNEFHFLARVGEKRKLLYYNKMNIEDSKSALLNNNKFVFKLVLPGSTKGKTVREKWLHEIFVLHLKISINDVPVLLTVLLSPLYIDRTVRYLRAAACTPSSRPERGWNSLFWYSR
jgi:hypothetical protein